MTRISFYLAKVVPDSFGSCGSSTCGLPRRLYCMNNRSERCLQTSIMWALKVEIRRAFTGACITRAQGSEIKFENVADAGAFKIRIRLVMRWWAGATLDKSRGYVLLFDISHE